MRVRKSPAALGESLEQCLFESKRAWFRQWKAGRPADYAWTQDIRTVYLICQLKHGGKVEVQVSLVSKDPGKSHVDFFKLQRRGKNSYHRVVDSLKVEER